MAQRVNESIEVDAPIDDVSRYWSNFQNFPTFMSNVEEVWMTAQDTSHWRVRGPLGKSVEFDAKTTEMNPNRGIGWNTVDGEVMTSGEARFEEITPGRTQVDVTMNYADPPGGAVGEAVTNILANPQRNLNEDLQNFASIVERGELGGPEAPDAEPLMAWRVRLDNLTRHAHFGTRPVGHSSAIRPRVRKLTGEGRRPLRAAHCGTGKP